MFAWIKHGQQDCVQASLSQAPVVHNQACSLTLPKFSRQPFYFQVYLLNITLKIHLYACYGLHTIRNQY